MMKAQSNLIKQGYLALLIGTLLTSPAAMAKDAEVSIGGAVEVEYGSGEDYSGAKGSDVALATVEIGIDAKINDKVSAHVGLLYEDDGGTPYDVDEGYITLGLGKGFNIQAGQLYVPFGMYETNMISDTLALEIGETRESVVMLNVEMGSLQASVYAYNGDTIEGTPADDNADQMGLRVAFVTDGMTIGVDYMNNAADSDALSGYLDPNINLVTYVPGQVVYANLKFGSLGVIVEHLMVDKFDDTEITFKGVGAEMSATNIEVSFDLSIAGMESTLAVAMQTTEEALALALPEEKLLVGLSMGIQDKTSLKFEYASSTDYAETDGGTGKDATSIGVQLAVEF